MPTIKTKKEMNLAELIEWGFKNEITSKEYTCNNKNGYKSVIFSTSGKVHLNNFHTYLADDKYEVEIEEEITEDTVLDAVVIVRKQISPYDRESTHVCRKGNVSINQVLSLQPNNSRFVYLEIHLMKNDRIDQLIWTKEKGLVE